MRFAGRMLGGAIGILLVAVILVVWSSRSAIHRALEEDLERALTTEAEMVQDALSEHPGTWPQLVGHWAALRGHSVTLFDSTGATLADNRIPPAQRDLPSQLDLPEVAAALAGRVGVARRSIDGARPAAGGARRGGARDLPGGPGARGAARRSGVACRPGALNRREPPVRPQEAGPVRRGPHHS